MVAVHIPAEEFAANQISYLFCFGAEYVEK